MSRTPFIAGNWKMHGRAAEARMGDEGADTNGAVVERDTPPPAMRQAQY